MNAPAPPAAPAAAAPAPAPARPLRRDALLALARVEAGRLLRHPALLAGLAAGVAVAAPRPSGLLVGVWWAARAAGRHERRPPPRWLLAAGLPLVAAGGLGQLVTAGVNP